MKNLERKHFLTRYAFISYHRGRCDAYQEQGYGPPKLESQVDIVCSFLRCPHSLLGSQQVTRSRKAFSWGPPPSNYGTPVSLLFDGSYKGKEESGNVASLDAASRIRFSIFLGTIEIQDVCSF